MEETQQSQQQLWAYLNWLQDCGQVHARVGVADPGEGDVAAGMPSEESLVPKAPARVWDLTFVSAAAMNAEETSMVQKIAAALGFTANSYQIVRAWNRTEQAFTVFLGDGPAALNSLVIAHPSAMMRDPSLKRSAWEALQSIKR